MAQENFKHFNKLKNRYWKFNNSLEIREVVRDFTNKIDKENEIAKVLESKGKQLELNLSLNPNYHDDVSDVISEHNKVVEEFKSKLIKYVKFK